MHIATCQDTGKLDHRHGSRTPASTTLPHDRQRLQARHQHDMAGTTSAPARHRQVNDRFMQAFHRRKLGVGCQLDRSALPRACACVRACVGGGGGARAWVCVITIGLPPIEKNGQRGNYLTSPHSRPKTGAWTMFV